MRPSFSLSLDPGLERGAPWGRDLYTFVTSAAGHMMRTLQRPRKNRPSKRQVNHRRFLHNMIQRKFADIEAANHRLASAIYFKDVEKNTSAVSSEQTATLEPPESQRDSECMITDGIDKSKSDKLSEVSGKRKKQQSKSQSFTCSDPTDNQSKKSPRKTSPHLAESTCVSSIKGAGELRGPELFHFDYYGEDSQHRAQISPEDTQTSLNDSSLTLFDHIIDMSPCFSPDLSPPSPGSCSLPIPACSDGSVSVTDLSEGLTDILDLLCVGSEEFAGCSDLEAYFDSFCASKGVTGPEPDSHEVTSAEPYCTYGYRYSCHGGQLSLNDQTNSPEELFHRQQTDDSGTLLQPWAAASHCDVARPQTLQHLHERSACMLANCDSRPCFHPFEGVAQSFSVPLHDLDMRPILPPPHEDDWLFTDILKDRKSPECC